MNDGGISLSVIVPVFNEEGNLLPLLGEVSRVLDPLDTSYEVLFVDDGSQDSSLEVMKELSLLNSSVRALALARHSGQSAALSAGFKAARGDVVVTLDADLQNDPRDILLLLSQLDTYDVVVGWRATRQDVFSKRLASRIGNFVRNCALHEDIRDTGCPLKAFKRAALANLPSFDGMHRFLPSLCSVRGFSVTQVPVAHRPRRSGKTKYGVWGRLFITLPDLLGVRWIRSRWIDCPAREESL